METGTGRERPRTFFLAGDLTIVSEQDLKTTADTVAKRLGIPPFVLDESGRWEEFEVYISRSFGLEFVFGVLPEPKPKEFGLSIKSRLDHVSYDGTEAQVDIAAYVAMILNQESGLRAIPD